MQKTAQKRNIFNKLREMTNVSGIAAEKFFNPEFKRVMESLREKDDQIRSIVSGESIGEASPGPDPKGLKFLLKSAKSNLNRREYMVAVTELGRFHKKMSDIITIIKSLDKDVDQVHHEFLFKDLDDYRKKELLDLKSRFAVKQQAELTKEASIMDFFMNIGTKRGRALAAWEKRYPQQVGKLKKDSGTLLDKSEGLFSHVIGSLKEMASARSVRNVDHYIKSADKIVVSYDKYNVFFKEYYNSNIKGFLEKVDLVVPTKEVTDSKELGKQEIPVNSPNLPKINAPTFNADLNMPTAPLPLVKMVEKDPFADNGAPTIPSPPPTGMQSNPNVSIIKSPRAETILPPKMPTNTLVSPVMPVKTYPQDNINIDTSSPISGPVKPAHQKFFNSLKSMSGENTDLLISHINRYAKLIQTSDVETSIKLFKLAKTIKG